MKTSKSLFLIIFVFLPSLTFSQEVDAINLQFREKSLPFGLTKKIPIQKPIVSLVLSGGGSRAISHIGVLKAIEELKIPIDHIIGTSMGSIIGGLYSAGYSLADLDSLMRTITWEELFFITGEDRINLFVDQKITEDRSLFTLRLNGLSPVIPQSINTGNKISNLLNTITFDAPINQTKSFDNLLFKYRAVTTDLISGDKFVIDNGSLSQAMRASSSVSFVLPPTLRDSLVLVDGGIVENLPIKSALELFPDVIIASDATSSLKDRDELIYPWDIADQIVSIPSRKVWAENIESVDCLIKHDLKKRKNDDFKKLSEVISMGYKSSLNKLQEVNELIELKFLEKLSDDDKIYNNLTFNRNQNAVERSLSEKYSNLKAIPKAQILYDLYMIYSDGKYKDLSATIVGDSTPILSVKYSYNPIVKSVRLDGVNLVEKETSNGLFNSIIGKPYNSDNVLESVLSLLRLYRSKEYLSVSVEKVNLNDNGQLVVFVNEGKISDILLTGNKKTLPSIIKREFPNISGEYLRKDNFIEGLKNLSATDLFDNVSVLIENGDSSSKKIKLNLNEKLPNVLRLGLRIDNENFTQFAFDLRNENLFGSGSEIGISISGGQRNMSYVFEHKSNRIFNTYLTYKAQAYYKFNDVNQYADDNSDEVKRFSRSKITEYRQRFYGGLLGVGAHLKKLGTLTAEAKYEVNDIDNISSFPLESEYKMNISSLKFRLQIDSQNRYPYPTKGIFIDTYYETAQKIFGGDISFAKFSFNYSSYFSIGSEHTITPKLVFGFADETLPLSQHFNFGGQSNFLGYREFEFRGRQILITSLQYRYKIPFNLYFDTYFKIRYDLGSSWINQEQIQFEDLKHGIGLAISFDTPIGPADFSVGRSLYLKDTSPDRILSRGPFMFYFTIGYYY